MSESNKNEEPQGKYWICDSCAHAKGADLNRLSSGITVIDN